MKNLAPEVVRLMQASLECRDSLRRLAARIQAADTPERQVEALKTAHAVAIANAELLRSALKSSNARRHEIVKKEAAPLWAITQGAR